MFRTPIMLISACAFIIPWSIANAGETIDYNHENGMAPGRGYDTVTGDVRGECLEFETAEAPLPTDSPALSLGLSQVEHFDDLLKRLGISGSASVAGSIAGGDAKVSFLNTITVNDYSLSLVAGVSTTKSTKIVKKPRLVEEAKTILLTQGLEAFRSSCGDSFIDGYNSGGELYSIIKIQTHSQSEYDTISGFLSGFYGALSASAELASTLDKISKTNKTEVYVYRAGGGEKNGQVAVTPAEVVKDVVSFADKLTPQNSYVYKAVVFPYSTLLDWPPEAKAIDVRLQREAIQRLMDARLSYSQQLANIDYIGNFPEQFEKFDGAALAQSAKAITTNLNTVIAAARACYSNFNLCAYPTELLAVDLRLPNRVAVAGMTAAQLADNRAQQETLRKLAEAARNEAQEREKAAAEESRKAQEDLDRVNKEAARANEEARKNKAEAEKAMKAALDEKAKAEALTKQAERDATAAREAAAKAQAQAAEAQRQAAAAQKKAEEAKKNLATVGGYILGGPAGAVIGRVIHW